MYHNKKVFYFFLIIFVLVGSAFTQTDHWRVIWNENPSTDTVTTYHIYKHTSATMDESHLIFSNDQDPPLIEYEDSDARIAQGVQLYYRIKAENIHGTSGFSDFASAAVPQIFALPDTIPVAASSIFTLYLNDFISDADLDPADYADSLTWTTSYDNGNAALQINITESDSLLVTTTGAWSGSEEVDFTVVDNDSFFDIASLVISFSSSTNQDPIATSQYDQYVNVGEPYEYSLTAIDPDGDDLTFSIIESPPFLQYTVNPTSVVFTGMPGIEHAGDHLISVLVLDLMGGSVLQTDTVTVNQVPSIMSSPLLTAVVGQTYMYPITADDPDGDPLLFTFNPALPGFLTAVDPTATSISITGTPASGDLGTHSININISDGKGGTDTQSYILTVVEEGTILISGMNTASFVATVVKLSWQTDTPTKDFIEYGLNQGYGRTSEMDDSYTMSHEQIVSGLSPETTYHYRIVSEDSLGSIGYSTDNTFSTSAATEEVVAFPIPYVASEHEGTTPGITFTNLPENATLYVYNLMGEMVFRKRDLNNVYNWDLRSKSGKEVLSGLYIFRVVRGSKEVGSGKVIIVR